MSRGFVKEDDQEEIPIVPPRAHLPEGAFNYVTPNGVAELLAERAELIARRDSQEANNENEKRIAVNHANAVLQLLDNRIATATVINISEQPLEEVKFGALVTVKIGKEPTFKQYQIVGVDEADIAKNKISFISPMARVLMNKKLGDEVVLHLVGGDKHFRIEAIKYQT